MLCAKKQKLMKTFIIVKIGKATPFWVDHFCVLEFSFFSL